MHKNVKNYVKNTVCFPERMTQSIWEQMDVIGLVDSEKVVAARHVHALTQAQVHVNILAIEARYLCELLCALNAINTHAMKR